MSAKVFRFAIFAAVSSERQAREDKASLEDQVKTARADGLNQGGIETTEPYVLDGYSRTGYVNLSDALEDIPPLARAIEDATSDKYDVLIMDNLERMGDLAPMLSTLFKRHKKQLHSARQSGPVTDPEHYDPSADEAGDILINVEGIIQKYRLNKLRRGYQVGIPNRIKRGLPAFRIPYGYDRTSKNEPPIPNENARFVVQIKDWFLEGYGLTFIARRLTEQNAPLPSKSGKAWHLESIRHILLNPFYAGIVAIGQKRGELSRKGLVYRQRTPQSQWQKSQGGHTPLWDETTHLAIQNEFDRRYKLKNYSKTIYPLAGLLRCTVCEQKLIRRRISIGGQLHAGLGCKSGESHVRILYTTAVELLAIELKSGLQSLHQNPADHAQREQDIQQELVDLKERRALVQEGFEARLYNKEEATVRISELERLERTAQIKLEEHQRNEQSRSQFLNLSHDVADLDYIAEWIQDDDPAIVNRILSALCQNVWLDPDHHLTLDWRP